MAYCVTTSSSKIPISESIFDKVHSEKTQKDFDSVSRPAHYTEGRKYEPIDVIEDWELGFCVGNALKYIGRAGRKSSESLSQKEKTIEDIDKAIWYLQRYKKEISKSSDEED